MKLLQYRIFLINLLLFFFSSAQADITNSQITSWLKNQNTLVLAIPVKFDDLDPIKSINAHSKFTLPLIFESLITINRNQELQPVLAKAWKISSDGKSIVLTIKPNHHFSDNKEVTSTDIVNSINRLCSAGSHESGQLSGLVNCENHSKGNKEKPEVFALNKYDVKFNIASNPTTFLYQLSSPNTVITKILKNKLIGSSSYLLKEKCDDYVILGVNPFYSGDFAPENSGIILFYSSDFNILTTINETKPDGILMYRMESLWNIKNENYKLIKSNPNITEILVLNNHKYPFDQYIVRKAISSELYNNFKTSCAPGSHKAYGIIPNGIGGSLDSMPPDNFLEITPAEVFSQVPQLKKHTIEITLHQLYDIKNDCETNQIINIAKKYNINIKFAYHKSYSELIPLFLHHKLDGFIDLYVFKNREAYSVFEFFSKNGENDANISQSNIDDMLKEATTMSSSHSRFQIYQRIAKYIQEENIVVPLFYMDHGNLMNKYLAGISEDFFFNPFFELPKISKNTYSKNA